MSKYYLSKRGKMERREALKEFGVDGSFHTPWSPPNHGTKNFTFKPCPLCGTLSPISNQDLPGVCSRETCRYKFYEVRRGKRN